MIARLHFLKEDRDALAAPNAGRSDAVLLSLASQLVDEVGGYAGAGRGQRVTQRDRPTARVELLQGDVERLLAGKCLCPECLVDLDLEHESVSCRIATAGLITWSTSESATPVLASIASIAGTGLVAENKR